MVSFGSVYDTTCTLLVSVTLCISGFVPFCGRCGLQTKFLVVVMICIFKESK